MKLQSAIQLLVFVGLLQALNLYAAEEKDALSLTPAEQKAATVTARNLLKPFWAKLAKPGKDESVFEVLIIPGGNTRSAGDAKPLKSSSNGVWVEVTRYPFDAKGEFPFASAHPNLTGTPEPKPGPNGVTPMVEASLFITKEADIADWRYRRGDKIVGSYIFRAMLKKAIQNTKPTGDDLFSDLDATGYEVMLADYVDP
jgi:hypothetical protein